MRKLVALAFLVSACSSGDGSIAPPDDVQVGGQWNFTENLTDQVNGISYVSQGTAQLSQSGRQFSGTTNQSYVFSGSDGSVQGSNVGALTGGQIEGDKLTFQGGSCQYTGSATGSPVNRMSGNATCDLAVSGTTLRFIGSWQAGR